MSTADTSERWENVLGRVERMLEATLAAADQRLESHDSSVADHGAASQARLGAMEDLRTFLAGLQQRMQSIETATSELDLCLASEESRLRDYLAEGEQLQQKLADWTARAIG